MQHRALPCLMIVRMNEIDELASAWPRERNGEGKRGCARFPYDAPTCVCVNRTHATKAHAPCKVPNERRNADDRGEEKSRCARSQAGGHQR